MGKYVNKCKGVGEVTIMEVSSDVDHDLDMATPMKKRKISSDGDVKLLSPPPLRLRSADFDNKDDSRENSVEDVASTESEEMILSIEFRAESGELETKKRPTHDNSSRQKVPSENEMADFFAAYEKDILKQFRAKYNFVFEKEEPLEGRYEWVQIGSED